MVEGWIMAFKDIKVLIPGTCEYYLLWQKELANVIKLKILRWEDYPGLSWWASIIIRIFIRGRRVVREEGRCYSADFED